MTTDRKLRVLIVDDDAAIRRCIRAVCEGEGHTVFETDHGAEAERLLAEGMDLAIVDGSFAWERGGRVGPWGYVMLCTARALGVPAAMVSGDIELVETAIANGFPAILKPASVEDIRGILNLPAVELEVGQR